ncbi:MAG: hypothetical protein KKD73_02445 [Proteobacteria bacterium]|nr:hypothetical protein [Pseudomonadota bacterium]MBU1640327.1 hypothetical protein [Pseudomonadota bacterium]
MHFSPDEYIEKPHQNKNIDDNLTSQSSDEQEPLLRLAPMEAPLINPCFAASQKLDLFFTYLDDQEYIQKYQFPHDSKELISNLINTLLKSPPVINGKILSSSDIIRNSAHIYRTLGTQNLTILYKIIENEADLMEETCRSFHEWFNISTQCLNHSYPLRPSLESLYEYASFFLETTGGKAYLARREGNLRLLAQYYSVLIIHQADQRELNKYNIKLTPLLPLLIEEIEESDELADKKSYLASLYDIREQLADRPGYQ